MRGLRVGFCFLSLLLALQALGQQDPVQISLQADSMRFRDFIRNVERSTGMKAYYPASMDTLRISLHIERASLRDVLGQALVGTNYHFATSDGYIYLTYNRTIVTELPLGFFGDVTTPHDSSDWLTAAYGEALQSDKVLAPENRVFEIGLGSRRTGQQKANLAGHVREAGSGEPVVGAVLYIESPQVAVITDGFGYYSITLPVGRNEVKIRCLGMKNTRRQVTMYGEGTLDIELQQDVIPLKEVVIEAEKDINVSGLQMGTDKLDIKALRQVPTALGETDILRVALMLPGVQSVGESSTGLNVRGGATDQNLILFCDAPIYNPSHLFGFFSAFNPDVLKSVELYKSGIPAEYGGRLSSILEVTTRDGNNKKFEGTGGIGLVTSRLTFEGPIIKDKLSFIVGGRTTYSDWLLKKVPDMAIRKSSASFYDFDAHVTYTIDDKNAIYLTAYQSGDQFRLNSDTLYHYNNRAAVAKWKHIFGNKLYSVLTGTYSGYDYIISSDQNTTNAFDLSFGIEQVALKADFNYFSGSKHTVDFGLYSTHYSVSPGEFQPLGAESLIRPDNIQQETGLESALYVGDRFDVSPDLSLYGGVRYSMFNALAPRETYIYAPGGAISEENIIDTVTYNRGRTFATYQGPEFRFSARYALAPDASVKLSYNRMRQYVQRLSNTTAIAPTDTWKLSDRYVKPQVGDQFSAGIYKNLKSNTIELSLEGYYKISHDVLDYKGGAELILNHHIETDVVNAEGKSYGIEVLVKKSTGKLNGWLSYTYSRSFLRSVTPFVEEIVNEGAYYPSGYDKPHDVTFIGNYKFSRRFSVSLNTTYSTGRPVTLPLEKYPFREATRLFYSERNAYRIRDYFRTDFSINVEGNHKVHQFIHSSWSFGVYNFTGRKNVYSVYFVSQDDTTRGYQLSIFGRPIPTVTYNFHF